MTKNSAVVAFDITAKDIPGVLFEITQVIANGNANISHIETGEKRNGKAKIYLELEGIDEKKAQSALVVIKDVLKVKPVPTFTEIYGKRIIVIGGGAQVAEVAKGAISEADRHNIRGENISIDTIALTSEEKLEKAVRAAGRLPRVEALVLAGSMMGGKITDAVKEVRDMGIVVISLNMAGSAKDACDLIVTDPIQAGVMSVMAVADTAEFDISKQRGKKY